MAKGKMDRRGSGPMWFAALVLIVFVLYSLALMASTADDCDDEGGRDHWVLIPPKWECNGTRGFG